MTRDAKTQASTDRIHKEVILDAPRARVWRALTDVEQFNRWFGVALETPFAPGGESSGKITYPGHTHLTMTIWIEAMEQERFFSFRWHPYAIEANVDYSAEPTTLVTFALEDAPRGATKLTIEESGFDAIPDARRAKAFASNDAGWAEEAERLQKYLAGGAVEG